MTCNTEKIVAGGSCIAKIDGKAVFVPFSLPGETLEIGITKDRVDYSFAKITSIIKGSPYRVEPICPLFGKCGGCTLQMAESAYQGELRLSILENILLRAHVVPKTGITLESGPQIEYRSRFQFHRTQNDTIGFMAASSDTIIPIKDCIIALPEIRTALQDGSLKGMARHYNARDRFHVFAHKRKLWIENESTECEVSLAGSSISFDVRGFFQSNLIMLERMIPIVCKMEDSRPRKRLLDFYSGVGTFSLFALPYFEETVLVEHNQDALTYARKNLKARETSITLCAVEDEKWPTHRAAKLTYDVAIIDPPRQGLSKKALEWFTQSNIPDIRYVSCDPVTFARDAVKFIASGFTLNKVIMFDFYPQTHHIETVGFFIR